MPPFAPPPPLNETLIYCSAVFSYNFPYSITYCTTAAVSYNMFSLDSHPTYQYRACVNSLSSDIFQPIIALRRFIHAVNGQNVRGTQRFEPHALSWSFCEEMNTAEVDSRKIDL